MVVVPGDSRGAGEAQENLGVLVAQENVVEIDNALVGDPYVAEPEISDPPAGVLGCAFGGLEEEKDEVFGVQVSFGRLPETGLLVDGLGNFQIDVMEDSHSRGSS